ncbi:MAG: hypothetical protein KatS3mg104_2288 [Phycisphaerae bacterium]|jgi:hypothetical protein|nr:MAG: hypothetical protein KatS3mg104_2288 [Phycisphaerae bacterium]
MPVLRQSLNGNPSPIRIRRFLEFVCLKTLTSYLFEFVNGKGLSLAIENDLDEMLPRVCKTHFVPGRRGICGFVSYNEGMIRQRIILR